MKPSEKEEIARIVDRYAWLAREQLFVESDLPHILDAIAKSLVKADAILARQAAQDAELKEASAMLDSYGAPILDEDGGTLDLAGRIEAMMIYRDALRKRRRAH